MLLNNDQLTIDNIPLPSTVEMLHNTITKFFLRALWRQLNADVQECVFFMSEDIERLDGRYGDYWTITKT